MVCPGQALVDPRGMPHSSTQNWQGQLPRHLLHEWQMHGVGQDWGPDDL